MSLTNLILRYSSENIIFKLDLLIVSKNSTFNYVVIVKVTIIVLMIEQTLKVKLSKPIFNFQDFINKQVIISHSNSLSRDLNIGDLQTFCQKYKSDINFVTYSQSVNDFLIVICLLSQNRAVELSTELFKYLTWKSISSTFHSCECNPSALLDEIQNLTRSILKEDISESSFSVNTDIDDNPNIGNVEHELTFEEKLSQWDGFAFDSLDQRVIEYKLPSTETEQLLGLFKTSLIVPEYSPLQKMRINNNNALLGIPVVSDSIIDEIIMHESLFKE